MHEFARIGSSRARNEKKKTTTRTTINNIGQQEVPRRARNEKKKTTTGTTRDNKWFLAGLGTERKKRQQEQQRTTNGVPRIARNEYILPRIARICTNGFLAGRGTKRRKRQQKQQ